MQHTSFSTALLALLALGTALSKGDTTTTWNGSAGNWTDAGRWSGGVVPQNSGPNLYDATIGAGTVTLNGAFAINQLALSGGTLGGTGPLTLAEGIAWSGGTISLPATGLVQLGAGSASTVTGASVFSGGVLRAGGNAMLTVQPGATLTLLDGANFFAQFSSPAWTLSNFGTLTARNTSGPGFMTLDASLAGAGALRVENTGTSHTLSLAGGGTLGGTVHLDANTTLELGGTLSVAAGTTFTGTGTIVSAGTVNLSGDITVPNLSSPVGELRLAGKALGVSGAAFIDDNGTLVAELRGTSVGQVSKLAVTGSLSAYGTLRVTLGAGFTPSAGDTFDILDFQTFTGAFTSVQLPALPVDRFWRTERLSAEGIISVSQVPPTFAMWQSTFGVGAFSADDDRDGIPNGVEFALGLNPTSASGVNGAPSKPTISIFANHARLHFNIPDPGATDITLVVQTSDNLGITDPWTPIATKVGAGAWTGPGAVTLGAAPGGRIAVTITDTKLVSTTRARFLRLVVSQP